MQRYRAHGRSLLAQVIAELRLFWRSRQTMFLAFLVPMMGMALFVYLNREGLLDRVFGAIFRGLRCSEPMPGAVSRMTLMTVGLIVYCMIDVAFESAVPRMVRERSSGVHKRLGGTPLPGGVFLAAKSLSAGLIVLIEVILVLAVGLVSSDVVVAGSGWLLGLVLLLGTSVTCAMAAIVSNLTSSADGAVLVVHAVYIPMLFLCGAFVPVDALPYGLQIVARVVPLTYFAEPFRRILVHGQGFAAISADLGILMGWLVVGWIVAIKTFRWE